MINDGSYSLKSCASGTFQKINKNLLTELTNPLQKVAFIRAAGDT